MKQTLKLKNKINELKTSLEDFKGRFKQAEEGISRVENTSFEVIKPEEQKEMNKNDGNLSDL